MNMVFFNRSRIHFFLAAAIVASSTVVFSLAAERASPIVPCRIPQDRQIA
jgi:hypothetical protein